MAAAKTVTIDRGTQAYEHLRELIVLGRLAPGSRLIETEIADRLGLSRTPIRSALQRLMQEGYIADPGIGRQSRPYVSPLTQDDARELFHIVAEMEGLSAWRAAGLRDRKALVRELNDLNTAILAEARKARPSRDRIHRLDNRFHRCYVEGGGGPRLLALHDSIKPQAERYTRLYIEALLDELSLSVEEHQKIVDAIETGDADGAQTAVRTNWRNAAERLAEVIKQSGELGSW